MTTPSHPSTNTAQRTNSQVVRSGVTPQNTTSEHVDFLGLSAALVGEHPIAYSVNLARITGDIKATLFISQLIYWTKVGVNVEHHDGWIFKSREQWTAETGLSRYEQESARLKLIQQGLIEESRVGSPARNCYRVVPQALGTALARLLRSEPVQWTLFDIRANADQFKALIGRHLAFYRVFTEITPTVASAVFLTKAISVHRSVLNAQLEREARSTNKTQQSADWFSLSPSQWQEETGLTNAQQRECKQKLCQLSYISEAIQTYPKKKTFIQLNLTKVSAALQTYMLAKVRQGGNASGLLGVLARGVQNNEVRHSGDVRNDCIHRQFGDVKNPNQVITPADTLNQQCENHPSSFHDSTNLDGGKSHIRRMEITHQLVGNNTIRRGLLTGLHARARYLTTEDLNTTTTTSRLPNAKSIHQDGGKSHNPVVVVISDLSEKQKNTAQRQNTKPNTVSQELNSDFIWFQWIPESVKATCEQLLKASGIPKVRQQVLVAELAGNLLDAGKVKNPLTYFASLLRSEKSVVGGIVPLVAQLAWHEHNDALQKHEAKNLANHEVIDRSSPEFIEQNKQARDRALAAFYERNPTLRKK